MDGVELERIAPSAMDDSWVEQVDRRVSLNEQMRWDLMRNRPLTKREKDLVREFYSSNFQDGWSYNQRHPWHRAIARFRHAVLKTVFKQPGKVLDAGCASGEIISEFRAAGTDCWGFDLCPDLHETVYPEARPYVRIGPVDAIPFSASDEFETLVSYDVFEHVPIDALERMPAELVRLGIRQMACIISADTIGAGHITIQDLAYYEDLFGAYGFRVMHELTEHLNRVPAPVAWNEAQQAVIWAEYYRSGKPRNGWNAVPGHLFLVRD